MADPGRRFDDLFNFVHDPATLLVAFDRVAGNQGARTPHWFERPSATARPHSLPTRLRCPGASAAGVDGLTAIDVEESIGVPGKTGPDREIVAAYPYRNACLLATVLLIALGVWLDWLPTSGWQGPPNMVLPALAMGVPAGGLLGRLVDDALPAAFGERWVGLWRASGVFARRIAFAALRRSVPAIVPQFGLVAVGLTGGAVPVETVFAVPGIGRTALGAAKAQDVPLLQGAVLVLLLLGLAAGVLAHLVRVRLLGPGLRDAALALPAPRQAPAGRLARAVPVALAAVLLMVTGWGLLRDPYTVKATARLSAPSWPHPLGTDGLGRDVLARLGHGAAATLSVAWRSAWSVISSPSRSASCRRCPPESPTSPTPCHRSSSASSSPRPSAPAPPALPSPSG
ncbi:ABC transporter permease subunit [Streptomyces sp. NPDC051219]|uniref:ABC transporter permease subunit n=1 Tax=Streptomyces sp. NPDC051219 TaxID=3155283 RepID=UPI00342D8D74